MIKYKIAYENKTIEFSTEEAAIQYKLDNNLTEEITSFEEEIIETVTVPQVVTPRQMRVALIMSGISLETIENKINSLPEPDQSITRVAWEYSTAFERDNPILNAMAPPIGLTGADVDQIFILAETF